MKVGPIAHGALLVAALGLSYRSWTREPASESKTGTHVVWNEDPSTFASLTYDGDGKSVKVERRGEGKDRYLWATVSRTAKKAKPPAAKDPHAGVPGAPPAMPGAPGATPPGAPGARAPGATPPGATPPAATPPAAGKPVPPATPPKAPAAKPVPPATPPATSQPGAPTTPAPAPATGPAKAPEPPAAAAPAVPPPAKAAVPAKPAAAPAPAKAPPGAGAAPPAAAPPPHAEHEDHGEDEMPPDDMPPDEEDGEPYAESEGDPDMDGGATIEAGETTVREFPVGEGGEALVTSFTQLHALRDLGVLDDARKTEYGLVESTENLTVFFTGGKSRSLVLGARVFGGQDRYVLDPEGGKGYVISTDIMKQIDGAETALGLKKLHAFDEEALDKLEIDTSYGKKSLVKKVVENEEGKQTGWADAAKPDAPDQTFTNFVSQLDGLKPIEYDPKLDANTLEKILTITYQDKSGGKLGSFEMFRQKAGPMVPATATEPARMPADQFYVRTEQTRVLGKASRMAADRLEGNDLRQLFGQPPRPDVATPVRPAPVGKDGKPMTLPPSLVPRGAAKP